MGMGLTWKQLRELSDAELVAKHDAAAKGTTVGLDYYLEELQRRDRERAIAQSQRLARASFWLTVANTLLALAAVAIALLA